MCNDGNWPVSDRQRERNPSSGAEIINLGVKKLNVVYKLITHHWYGVKPSIDLSMWKRYINILKHCNICIFNFVSSVKELSHGTALKTGNDGQEGEGKQVVRLINYF